MSEEEFKDKVNLICLVSDGDDKDSEHTKERNPVLNTYVDAIKLLSVMDESHGKAHFHLVCTEDDVSALEKKLGETDISPTRFTIHPAKMSVPMDAEEVEGFRDKPTTTNKAIELVGTRGITRENSGICSRGNSAAYVDSLNKTFGTLDNIERVVFLSHAPAVYPSKDGGLKYDRFYQMDAGANLGLTAEDLAKAVVLSVEFIRNTEGISVPAVGTFGYGSEDNKTTPVVRRALPKLRRYADDFGFEFKGNVDKEILGVVNLYAGPMKELNVTIKTAQEWATNVLAAIKWEVGTSLGQIQTRVDPKECKAFMELFQQYFGPGLDKLKDAFNKHRYNGAYVIGANGNAVKIHGASPAEGVRYGIVKLYNAITSQILESCRPVSKRL